MKRKLLKAALAVGVVAVMISCTNTGKTKENSFEWGGEVIGAVKRYGVDRNIDIVMDNLDTVRTVNTEDLDPETYTDGKRVVAHVYMNKRTLVGNHYVFNSMVDNMAPMPVKKVLDLSYVNSDPERVDSVGNDPISLNTNGTVVSGNYLDVRYIYEYDSKADKKHNITFVSDDEKTDESTLYLTLRHNADNDEGKDIFNGLLSVDIKKYLDGAKNGKLRIELFYNDGVNDKKEIISWERPDYMK